MVGSWITKKTEIEDIIKEQFQASLENLYKKKSWKSQKTSWSILVQIFHADSMMPTRSPKSHFSALKIANRRSCHHILNPRVKNVVLAQNGMDYGAKGDSNKKLHVEQ